MNRSLRSITFASLVLVTTACGISATGELDPENGGAGGVIQGGMGGTAGKSGHGGGGVGGAVGGTEQGGAGQGGAGQGGDEPGGAGQGGDEQGGAGQGGDEPGGAGQGGDEPGGAGQGGDEPGGAGQGGGEPGGAGQGGDELGGAGQGGDEPGGAGQGGDEPGGAGQGGAGQGGAGQGGAGAGGAGAGGAGQGGAGQGGGCNVGETLCSGTCVDTKTDKNNCGACGKLCAGTCSDSKCTVSLFSSMTPTCTVTGSTANTELGAKFTVSAAGKATAIRFFHKAGMGTSFAVNLWDAATKNNLSTALVTLQPGETGWIEVALPTPVALAVGTTYVMSYTAEDGKFCHLAGAPAAKTVGALTFLSDNSYYNTSGGFPGTKFATNYFVDVVFTAD